MIITCEECQTKFSLEQDLLKETGSKIRCSICKHVFTAFPPKEEPQIEEVLTKKAEETVVIHPEEVPKEEDQISDLEDDLSEEIEEELSKEEEELEPISFEDFSQLDSDVIKKKEVEEVSDVTVHIDPEDFEMEIPEIERKVTDIIDLREGQRNVNIRGQLLDDPIQRDIDTIRGPTMVTNFRIDDGTGEARVSLWRDHAEAAMDLTAGAEIRLEYMNVREPFDGLIQVSSGAFTKIVIERE